METPTLSTITAPTISMRPKLSPKPGIAGGAGMGPSTRCRSGAEAGVKLDFRIFPGRLSPLLRMSRPNSSDRPTRRPWK